jgi:hypothetical protein
MVGRSRSPSSKILPMLWCGHSRWRPATSTPLSWRAARRFTGPFPFGHEAVADVIIAVGEFWRAAGAGAHDPADVGREVVR